MNLGEKEVSLLKDFFHSKYHTSEINRSAFEELLNTKFKNQCDRTQAKRSLLDIKSNLEMQRLSAKNLMDEHQSERTMLINMFNFKTAINSLKVLSQFNIDNLAKYMDKQNEGFVDIGEFTAEVSNSGQTMGASMRSST